MCDTYDHEGKPIPTNSRAGAASIFEKVTEEFRLVSVW